MRKMEKNGRGGPCLTCLHDTRSRTSRMENMASRTSSGMPQLGAILIVYNECCKCLGLVVRKVWFRLGWSAAE